MLTTTVFPVIFYWALGCLGFAVNAYLLAFTLSALPFVPAVTDNSSSTGCDSLPRRGFILTVATLLFVVFLIVFHTVLTQSILIIWSAAVLSAALAYLSPGEILITPNGLLRAHPLRGNILLPWRHLDHYEVRKGVANTIYFRTRSGRTISVNNWTHSTPEILEQIKPVAPLTEQPYHHQHWYGG